MEVYLNKEETILVKNLIKLEMENQLEFQFLSNKDIKSKIDYTFILMDCYKDVNVRLDNHLNNLNKNEHALAKLPNSVIELMEVVLVETVKGEIPETLKPSLEKNFNNIFTKIKNILKNKDSANLKVNMFGIGFA